MLYYKPLSFFEKKKKVEIKSSLYYKLVYICSVN